MLFDYMLLVSFLVNGKLLVIKFLENQKLYMDLPMSGVHDPKFRIAQESPVLIHAIDHGHS